MSYVLGSAAEAMNVTDHGIQYRPAGTAHAVDIQSLAHGSDAVLAYAICGHAVRAWPEQPFDASAHGVHAECADRVRCG